MKNIILLILTFFYIQTQATFGGPREVKAIGYTDTDVYFIMEYFDESGRNPELWKYNFSTEKITIDYNWMPVDGNLESAIKKLNINKMKKEFDEYTFNVGDIDINSYEPIESLNKELDVYEMTYPYGIHYNYFSIEVETCDDGEPQIHHHFTINNTHFAIIRYTGLCYEMGYKKDTVFAFSDEVNEIITDSIPIDSDSIELVDSSKVEKQEKGNDEEKKETYWKRGTPNYLFIIFPVVMVLLAVVVLKWKKKEED